MKNFQKTATNSLLFRLYLIKSLPMAWLAGIRVRKLEIASSEVTIPFKFLTKNPFKSIYFACLSMAAELSTGILCVQAIQNSNPPMSMLVVGMQAQFTKKATGLITFKCENGKEIAQAVSDSKLSGDGATVTTISRGFDQQGDTVGEFHFTWSFKQKAKKS